MTSVTNNLEYAPPLPLRKRRAFRRLWAIAALLAFGVLAAVYFPWAWLQVRLWYWQQQSMAYVAPADQVVCEEAPAWAGVRPPFLAAAALPTPLANLQALSPVQSLQPQGPVLYLHERTTASGQRRLLMIRRIPPAQRQSWDAPIGIVVSQWRIRPLFFADAGLTSDRYADPFPQLFDADQTKTALTLFAGQSDPADSAKFTIEFETAEGRGTLEGTLTDVPGSANDPEIVWRVR